jgi:hypothetical protein
MELHSIVLVRNEADIWAGFLDYHKRFFDKIIVVDHQSTDGTLEITNDLISRGEPIELLRYRYRGYFQSEISNAVARKSFDAGADWIFFLDADEFLAVPDRASLEMLLHNSYSDVAAFFWRNLVPTAFGSFDAFDLMQRFRWNGETSRYGKITIAATYAAQNPGFHVHMGNHAVSPSYEAPPAPTSNLGAILHIPIRSIERLRHKLALGVAAYRAKASRNSSEGFHWFELNKRLEDGNIDRKFLQGVIAQYGEPLDQIRPVTVDESGWQDAFLTTAVQLQESIPLPISLHDSARGEAILAWHTSRLSAGVAVSVREQDGELRLQPRPVKGTGDLGPDIFGALTPTNGAMRWLPDDFAPADFLAIMAESFEPIATLVPSAWSGHEPYLRGLIAALRPRRCVEIGTHFGQSFFTACQAVEHLQLKAECVAIDSWMGDHQAGFYDDSVFTGFIHILRTRHPETGYYIRSIFDDAVACFDDGSIDLLHVDGLHTYEAVKNDFEKWLPKLSDRGVIIFHDTTVYEGDFGVWRLWEELKKKYPTFNLLHCHGFGTVYVGVQPSPVAKLLRRLSSDEGLGTFVNYLFRNLGSLVVLNAKTALRVGDLENEAQRSREALEADNQRLREEIARSETRSQIATAKASELQAQIEAVWRSTSWRVTKPLRTVSPLFRLGARND